MAVTTVFLIIFLMASSTAAVSQQKQKCHPQDKKALIQIDNALGNPPVDFPQTPWLPSTDCCSWNGIGCHPKTNRVTDLILTVLDLPRPAQIPAAVGDLDQLQNLQFGVIPNLVGPIPPSLAKLNNLKYLTIYSTNVSGPIPDFLSHLSHLHQLQLHYSSFSGHIPPSLSLLPTFNHLSLDGNHLHGPIPPSFPPRLSLLQLSRNLLSGTIPPPSPLSPT